MPRVAAAPKKRGAGPKSTKLAEEFTKGTVITDILKKTWRLGEVIGQGGFGLVYHANKADDCSTTTSSNAQYVIKIEPGANGPLFCEMNFYIRVAKQDFIKEFIKSHKLKYLPVPPYIGSGLHTYNSVSYRFLVMPRYGSDLQKLLQTGGGTFPDAAVFAIGIQMINALQYLHEKEYVHADIKASNILLGFNGHSENKDEVYLADYGLAYRYTANNNHKEYKVDPRSAHNGTIEFTSRDAHKGVFPSRRGDLEILGFCLMQWLCGKLPWESNLTNPTAVAQEKEECMNDVNKFIRTCLAGSTNASSDSMHQYLEEVNKLGYEDEPNYKKFKDLLKSALTKVGQKDEWKICFAEKKATKRKSQSAPSPRITSKKPKTDEKKGKGKIISPTCGKKTVTASPVKTKGRPPRKTPVIANGKSPSVDSPNVKTGPIFTARKRSPLKSPVVKHSEAVKPKKTYQLPKPTNPSPRKSPATPRAKTATKYIRRVRKTHVTRNDASIQTTPGLKSNV